VRLKRETVSKFWCPACNARPGQPCLVEGTGESRPAMHAARVKKAEQLIAASLKRGGWTGGGQASD
jgi:hypothetical protein